jgi:acetyl esterase/lipase
MPELHSSLGIAYGPQPRQGCDLFIPDSQDDSTLVVCFHGGWWSHGRHEDLRGFCLHLAELGCPTATVGYRLIGDGARHGQDIIDDARAGTLKAIEEAACAGANPGSVVLLGSGSGSLIALAVAAQLSLDPKLHVRGAIACGVSPTLEHWEGCSATVAKALDQFAGTNRHALSPLHLQPDHLPPLLLLHGDNDLEVPAKLAQRLHARVIEAGEISTLAVLSGLGHQFIEQPFERGAKAALERILPFIQEHARNPEREQLFAGRCQP